MGSQRTVQCEIIWSAASRRAEIYWARWSYGRTISRTTFLRVVYGKWVSCQLAVVGNRALAVKQNRPGTTEVYLHWAGRVASQLASSVLHLDITLALLTKANRNRASPNLQMAA
jgi:hypothetical protein